MSSSLASVSSDIACPTSHEFSVQTGSMEDNNYVKVKKTEADLFYESMLSFTYGNMSPGLNYFRGTCHTNKWTVEKIKAALLLFCRYVYEINGINTLNALGAPEKNWDDKKVLESYLDKKTTCIFSEEVTFNCKTNTYMKQKIALTDFLVKMLTVIFKLVHCFNPTLLDDTNPYFNELFKSIELYRHTIGYEHRGTPGGAENNLYEQFVRKLEIELNKCFPTPIIVQRCKPLEGYGCARLIVAEANATGVKQTIFISKDNSAETNNPVKGGRRSGRSVSRRSSKHRRSLRKRSYRKRSYRKVLIYAPPKGWGRN